jgi:hypothetical protein
MEITVKYATISTLVMLLGWVKNCIIYVGLRLVGTSRTFFTRDSIGFFFQEEENGHVDYRGGAAKQTGAASSIIYIDDRI